MLPFFPPYDGADAGFDPVDHTEVDARLGTWSDVARLAKDFDLMVDVIVNHVSADSPPFVDWLAHGGRSEYDGMFLTFAGVFPDGATEEMLLRLYRPRPGLPFTPYQLGGRYQAAGLDDVHTAADRYRRAARRGRASTWSRCSIGSPRPGSDECVWTRSAMR